MTAKAQHTPEPWTITHSAPNWTEIWAEQHPKRTDDIDNRFLVAKINMCMGEESVANACLFEAAPRLLKALEYIVNWNDEDWSADTARDLAITAIAKARGE